MIRQQIELSLKYFLFIVSQISRGEKKFCKTELLNDLLLETIASSHQKMPVDIIVDEDPNWFPVR